MLVWKFVRGIFEVRSKCSYLRMVNIIEWCGYCCWVWRFFYDICGVVFGWGWFDDWNVIIVYEVEIIVMCFGWYKFEEDVYYCYCI